LRILTTTILGKMLKAPFFL